MKIERTAQEIILRIPCDLDVVVLQRIITYLKFTEATKGASGTEAQADALAAESKRDWWSENKHRFTR